MASEINTKHKICFIQPFLLRFPRGLERYCIHLANELATLGHQVTLITWDEPQGKPISKIDDRIQILKVPYFRYFRALWAIPFYVYYLVKNNFDFVNVFFAGFGEAESIVLSRRFRTYKTLYIVGYPFHVSPHRFEEFKKWGMENLLDKIIVKTRFMVEGISEFFQRSDVEVIHNGIDLNLFNQQNLRGQDNISFEEYGVKSDEKILLTVAALEERKGIQHVIRALPALLDVNKKVHYFVVGDGPYRKYLEKLTAELGLQDIVHFIGYTDNVFPFYQQADIFLLLAHGEAFGNVLLEAMAMGLPLVVSDQPPFDELLNDKVARFVLETDHQELVEILGELISDPSKCEEIGAAGKAYVKAHFAWPIVVQEYVRLLDSLRE